MLQIAFARRRFPAMRFLRFLIPLLALCLIAGAKKPTVSVRFHVQVNEVTGAPFMMTAQLPGTNEKVTLSKTAEISEDDIVAIYPFAADDGSIGCAFKLNSHGKLVINTLSTEARGATLVGFINGRAVTAMLIDRPITDDLIVIKRGIVPLEAQLLAKAFPVLGQNNEKTSRKKAKAARSYIPEASPGN
jgi:hypothetical protein